MKMTFNQRSGTLRVQFTAVPVSESDEHKKGVILDASTQMTDLNSVQFKVAF